MSTSGSENSSKSFWVRANYPRELRFERAYTYLLESYVKGLLPDNVTVTYTQKALLEQLQGKLRSGFQSHLIGS